LARHDLTHTDRVFLDVVNVAVLVAFAIDYVVEFLVVSNKRSYMRHEWTSLLIVLAQAAALAPALAALGVLRILRAGRAFRTVAVVVRIVTIGGSAAREGRTVLRRHAAGFALGMAGFTWITSAVAFTLVEDVGTDGRLRYFFDALWWSSATITTVGYGDVAPVTTPGRLVGVVTMLVGISTFAVVTAKIAEFLVRADMQSSDQ
jgi:voltage-gated potassium channel